MLLWVKQSMVTLCENWINHGLLRDTYKTVLQIMFLLKTPEYNMK